MTSDDLGLAQSPAQAAEGGVRKALKALIKATQEFHEAATSHFNDSDYDFDLFLAKAEAELSVTALPDAIAALSAEGSATIAAARLAAEEMRERAAEDERDRLLAIANRQRYTPVSVWLVRNGAVPPSDRAIFRSRAQKAAATPTIADPDGEARS